MIDKREGKNEPKFSEQESELGTESFENAAEEVVNMADAKVRDLEIEVAAEVVEKEEEGIQSGISPEEIAEIKKQLGIFGIIDKIKAKAREAADNFRESIMDQKIRRFLAKNIEDCFDNDWVREFVQTLTLEQIKRHPEIIKRVKKIFLYHFQCLAEDKYFSSPVTTDFGRGGNQPKLDFSLEAMQKWIAVFQDKPEIIKIIANQPEIYPLQDKIFQRMIHDVHNQRYASSARDLMFMDKDRANRLLIEAISQNIGNKNSGYDARRIDITQACVDFNLDRSTKFNLATKWFISKMESDYPYIESHNFKNTFVLSDQDFLDFIEQYRSILVESIYKTSTKELSAGGPSAVLNFWEHLEGFQLKVGIDEFKNHPYLREHLREIILERARWAWGENSLKIIEFLQSLSSEPIEKILQSSEGQKALYAGAAYLMSIGRNAGTLDGFLKQYHLDLLTFQQDPETTRVFCETVKEDIKAKRNFWRGEIEEYLQIPEEKTHDLKILMIDNLVNGEASDLYRAISLVSSMSLAPEEEKLILEKIHNAKIRIVISFLSQDRPEFIGAMKLIFSANLTSQEEKYISQNVFGVENKFSYLSRINNLIADKTIPEIAISALLKQHNRFVIKTDEQIKNYFDIIEKISDSPSQEMVRVRDQLIDQILATDDPHKTYEIISNIFIQNNIPLVGKIQRIFDALFPDDLLGTTLGEKSSPVLVKASARKRRHIISQDLLKVHIESANPSLKSFLELFKQAEPLISKLEKQEELSVDEQKKLTYVFKKLKTIVDVSQRGRLTGFDQVNLLTLPIAYQELYQQLGVKSNQTVSERIVEMFVRPLGYKTVDGIIDRMSYSQREADERSRQLVASSRLKVESGDLVKGVGSEYIVPILENGSVASEYLGASSDSNATPLDTDLELVGENGEIKIASGYGDLIFIIKNRGQFQLTSSEQSKDTKFDPTKYELFRTGVMGENHYGVRTGFPCTEIDFMIFRIDDLKKQENLFYSIARNGYYIPVVNEKHELIFTPELYDEYRSCFAGIERFGGSDIKFISSQGEEYYTEIQHLVEGKKQDIERLTKLKKEIRTMILEILAKFDIKLKPEYDDSLIGAELLDIGSTGRNTNMVGEGDFDFNLKLDAKDFHKYPEIAQEIQQKLGNEMSQPPIMASSGNNFQFRFFGTNIFSQKNIDIDVGFVKKSDLNVYASHDAVNDKLENISQRYGQETYQEVVANILLAKKFLKSGKAYKKGDYGQGGLGGIGVENLILAYGCNVKLAFLAFYRAAKNPDGSIKSFDSFKQEFKLFDAGMDLRSNHHDNFVYNMNSDGYHRMIAIIQEKFPESS